MRRGACQSWQESGGGSSSVGSGGYGKEKDEKSYTEGTEVGAQRAPRGCWRRDGRRLGSIEERFLPPQTPVEMTDLGFVETNHFAGTLGKLWGTMPRLSLMAMILSTGMSLRRSTWPLRHVISS